MPCMKCGAQMRLAAIEPLVCDLAGMIDAHEARHVAAPARIGRCRGGFAGGRAAA